jgi:hypothetical protein
VPGSVPAAAPPAQPKSLLGRIGDFIGDVSNAYNEGQKGVIKGAMNTVAGLGELVNKDQTRYNPQAADAYRQAHPEASPDEALAATMQAADPQGHIHAVKAATDWLRDHAHDNNVWQQLGDMGENLGEFFIPVLGEEAGAAKVGAKLGAEAPTFADKAAQTAKVARFMETPAGQKLAQLAALGARTLKAAATGGARAGVETGAQTYVKTGGDADAATTAAGEGALAGGVLSGAGAGVMAAREASATRTAAADAAKAAYENKPAVEAARVEAMKAARQATAQQMVKDTAKGAARGVVDRMNEALQPPLAITGEPSAEAHFEPIDADQAMAKTNSFGDAADVAREAAKPIYAKLDEATGGQFTKLKNARSSAYRAGNMTAYKDATEGINNLLKKTPDSVNPEEFAAAKSAWNDERDLDRIHNAVEGAFNGISETQAAEPGTSPRLIKGGDATGALQTRIGGLLRGKNALSEDRIGQLLGPEGLTGLYRASHLVSTPELSKATQELADAVAKEFPKPEPTNKLASRISHTIGTGAAAGAISHLTGQPYAFVLPALMGSRYVLRQVITNPAIGQMFEHAVDYGATPKNAAKIIAAMIQRNATADSQNVQPGNQKE